MSTTVRRPLPQNRRLVAGAAVTLSLAAGVASVVSFGGADGTDRAANEVPTRGELLRSLRPEERRYVEWVMSATPEQLAAAFGTEGVRVPHPVKSGEAVR